MKYKTSHRIVTAVALLVILPLSMWGWYMIIQRICDG